jgi:hypothetical protein
MGWITFDETQPVHPSDSLKPDIADVVKISNTALDANSLSPSIRAVVSPF